MSHPLHPRLPGRPRLEWVIVRGEAHHVSTWADLAPSERPDSVCPICNQAMTLKLGDKVAHHAAHRPGTTTCSAARSHGINGAADVNDRFSRAHRSLDRDQISLPSPACRVTSSSFAKAILVGRAGGPAETIVVQGIPLTVLRLATGSRSSTSWHRIITDRPELSQILNATTTGQSIYLEGQISHRPYVDRSGTTQRVTEILLDQIVAPYRESD